MAPMSIPGSPDRVASRQSTSAGARYGESYSGECRTQATNSHAHRTRLLHVPVPSDVRAPSPRGRPAGSATAAHHPVCGCYAFVALSAPPRSARRHSPAANPRLPLYVRCLCFRRLCLHACCGRRALRALRGALSLAACCPSCRCGAEHDSPLTLVAHVDTPRTCMHAPGSSCLRHAGCVLMPAMRGCRSTRGC